MSSTVWADLAVSRAVQYGVPYIDAGTLQPTVDAGASGTLINFSYVPNAAVLTGSGVLNVGTLGDTSGADVISAGAQVDSYIPVGNQLPAIPGMVPGHSVSSSRGTRYLPSIILAGDLVGEYGGYGLVTLAAGGGVNSYAKLAGINIFASGASATNPGGELRFGTKANAADTFTDWFKLDNTGAFQPMAASIPATPLVQSIARIGKPGFGIGALSVDYAQAAAAGNVTINKMAGQLQIALGAATVTLTNSLITANSVVIAQIAQADATLTFIKSVVSAAGSCVITGNANATANCKISFLVVGTDS